MTKTIALALLALQLAAPALAQASDPWYTTKMVRAERDLGMVTFDVNPKTLKCYVDQTWDQGQIEFDSPTVVAGTDSSHKHWSRSVEGEGQCDELLPPVAAEIADSRISLKMRAQTDYVATYYNDGKCIFSIAEHVSGEHATLGTFDAYRELVELNLTTESCKLAFATWPVN
ncbi:MAG: hypothetical protein AAB250_00550 [Bdellovibrionota bacterium]